MGPVSKKSGASLHQLLGSAPSLKCGYTRPIIMRALENCLALCRGLNIIHGMNDYQPHSELKYKPRWIAPLLMDAAKDHTIVVLTGARQVGKSTLFKNQRNCWLWKSNYRVRQNSPILRH
jgi:hypothetical protein